MGVGRRADGVTQPGVVVAEPCRVSSPPGGRFGQPRRFPMNQFDLFECFLRFSCNNLTIFFMIFVVVVVVVVVVFLSFFLGGEKKE